MRRMAQFFTAAPAVMAAGVINNSQDNISSQLTNTSSNSTDYFNETEPSLTIVLSIVGGCAVLFFVGLFFTLRKMFKEHPDAAFEADTPRPR